MYYKITNTDSVVYQKLHALRSQELQFEKDNIKAIEEKTGMTWTNSFGNHGQQTFRRVTSYMGFEFDQDVKLVDPKMIIWKPFKDDPKISVPNRRTVMGRAMQEFLNNGLKGGRYDNVLHALNLNADLRRFSFPYVEILTNKTIIVFLDDQYDPKITDLIEITRTEFYQLVKESKDIEIE